MTKPRKRRTSKARQAVSETIRYEQKTGKKIRLSAAVLKYREGRIMNEVNQPDKWREHGIMKDDRDDQIAAIRQELAAALHDKGVWEECSNIHAHNMRAQQTRAEQAEAKLAQVTASYDRFEAEHNRLVALNEADSAKLRQRVEELERELATKLEASASHVMRELHAALEKERTRVGERHTPQRRSFRAKDGSMKLDDACYQCGLALRDQIHLEIKL